MNGPVSWEEFHNEAVEVAKAEPLVASFLNQIIIQSPCWKEAISRLLARSFVGIIDETTWYRIFFDVFNGRYGQYEGENVCDMMVIDLKAIQDRDPACKRLTNAFIYFKGFKSLQSHRVAHILWSIGKVDIAYAIQSRCSELWSVDIHPGAKIGCGLMIDHGTGVVIGETAVVGRYCSFLHGVTLGSTGKNSGDRHPKIGDGVLIGCGAIVLGNITIGRSSKIGSGSVVMKALPPNVTAVGNPARIVGRSVETTSAAAEMDLALKNVVTPCGTLFCHSWSLWADGAFEFEELDVKKQGSMDINDFASALKSKFHVNPSPACLELIFKKFDGDGDGFITKTEFDFVMAQLQTVFEESEEGQSCRRRSSSVSDCGSDSGLSSHISSSDCMDTRSDTISSNCSTISDPESSNSSISRASRADYVIINYLQKISQYVSEGSCI